MTDQKVSEVPASVNLNDEEQLDELVRKASTPSLATLFQSAKDRGLLKPGKEYGNT